MIHRRQSKFQIGVMVNVFACVIVSILQLTEINVILFEIQIIFLNKIYIFFNEDFIWFSFGSNLFCMQQ